MVPAACLLAAALVTDAAGYLDTPVLRYTAPPAVEKLFDRLSADRPLSADDRRLLEADGGRPHFPLRMLSDEPIRGDAAREAFTAYTLARHTDRADGWAKAGRLDLIAESVAVIARGRAGNTDVLAERLSPALTDLAGKRVREAVTAAVKPDGKEAARVLDLRLYRFEVRGAKAVLNLLDRPRFQDTVVAPVVRVDDPQSRRPPDGVAAPRRTDFAAWFTDRLDVVRAAHLSDSVCVVAGEVTGRPAKGTGRLGPRWTTSLVVANGDDACGTLEFSAVIADGDVHLPADADHTDSLVIARGNIVCDGALCSDEGVYVAGGTITAKRLGGSKPGFLLAAGGLKLADETDGRPDPLRAKGVVLDGVGPAELGVRWFEPTDVGLELAADGNTCTVKGVTDASPFAGKLRPGDSLKAINTARTPTPDAARRALRRAVVLGFAVVEFVRDGREYARLVPVEGVR